MAHRFFHPGPLSPASEITLSAEQSGHLRNALRVKEGESVTVVDGQGTVAVAQVLSNAAHASRLRIESVTHQPSPFRVQLAFGIPKGAALELIIHKGTELGVRSFQPLLSQHSLTPDRWNAGRWERVVQETIKQCQSPVAPVVNPPQKLATWLAQRDSHYRLLFCHEARREPTPLKASETSMDLLVGAEGGWSEDETQAILSRGAEPLGLGSNRLRAETAALVGLVLAKKAAGEL